MRIWIWILPDPVTSRIQRWQSCPQAGRISRCSPKGSVSPKLPTRVSFIRLFLVLPHQANSHAPMPPLPISFRCSATGAAVCSAGWGQTIPLVQAGQVVVEVRATRV